MPHPTETILTDERPVALVVDATFDAETFTIDTTTLDGQPVVRLSMREAGVERHLTAVESLALVRALLSRLAYVGFPPEVPRPAFCGAHPVGVNTGCGACAEIRAQRIENMFGGA